MRRLHALVLVGVLSAALPARGEVTSKSSEGFQLEHQATSKRAPDEVYRALGQVGRWWSSQHTFSGSASNLSLVLEAGGCFCERWSDGGVEHGRVVQTAKGKLLRLHATLGPLLDFPVAAVLTFRLEPKGEGTLLKVSYLVNGGRVANPAAGAGKWAAPADRVLAEQIARLVRFVDTGKPE